MVGEYEGDILNLNIEPLKTDLSRALSRLEAAYAEFNAANINLSPFKQNVTTFTKDVSILETEIEKANKLLADDKGEIIELNGFISELEDKLTKANIERDNYNKRVIETQEFITQSLARVESMKQEITKLNLKIKEIISITDSLKKNSKGFEREVDGIRNKIKINERRETDLISKITDVKLLISKQELNLEPSELDNINEMIKLLNNEIPTIREKIDQLSLQCNGLNNVDTEVIDSKLVLKFQPSDF